MKQQSPEASHEALREKRSLLAASLLLFFIYYGGVEIPQVAIMGATVKLKNPIAVYHLAWAVWAYLFLRYYQLTRPFVPALRTAYAEALRQRVADLLRGIARRNSPPETIQSTSKEEVVFNPWYRPTVVAFGLGSGAHIKQIFHQRVPLHRAVGVYLGSAFNVGIKTPAFTDYHFPYVVAVLCAAYAGFHALRRVFL